MFIEAKDGGSGGDNWSYKSCKAAVKSSPPTNQHPVFLQAGCPSCRPTNSVKALKGKYHTPWTCLLQAHLGFFQRCLWPLIAPGYLGGGLPCLSSALWCHYPTRYDNKKRKPHRRTSFTLSLSYYRFSKMKKWNEEKSWIPATCDETDIFQSRGQNRHSQRSGIYTKSHKEFNRNITWI